MATVFQAITGPFGVIALMVFIGGAFLAGQLFLKREITYRDKLLGKQEGQIERQQALFESALGMIKHDLLPLLETRRADPRGGP